MTLGFIADSLSSGSGLGRPMVDATGLSGTFDFDLEWTRNEPSAVGSTGVEESSGPDFAEALREQLGIKLESRKRPMKMPLIDHVERPDAN